ncbi:putative sodium-coupled neutral amino acid transporter 7 [Fragariocoptes setiger]|uniref:Sodium-coupled neutral amino acid transporter 7 n=1 Tax=Fragariocoptes setiger TaxID=1670756 RepID=A0ABQ7S6D9_9ACAR|nr:putative sodium-coupled neutral amino acid transporter 7 [Fragariocoptes setiger]
MSSSVNCIDWTVVSGRQTEQTPLLKHLQGVNWGVASFLLVNAALGAGMLNYPYAYGQVGGVLAAAIIQMVLLVFVASTMFILIYCSDLNNDDTYHDVLMSMCGKRAQQLSAASIMLTCFGINITFLVIIGDQYDRLFESLLPEHEGSWYLDRRFIIGITALLFILPMCYARRLDCLRYASTLGIFAMLYVAFLTVYEFYILDENTMIDKGPIKTSPDDWLSLVTVIPVMCFAYQTHEVIIPVYACLRQRNMANFMKATILGLVILFFLYNVVGAYGYLTFGSNVNPDITLLYDGTDPVVVIGIIALVIKIITTYPPLLFCGRGALDGLYAEFRQMSPNKFAETETKRRVIITSIWFILTVVLALYAPNISITIQLLGSLASVNVFVFPGMCLISLTKRLRRAKVGYLSLDSPCDRPLVPERGISALNALLLQAFAWILIGFGFFIFVIEIINVFGIA